MGLCLHTIITVSFVLIAMIDTINAIDRMPCAEGVDAAGIVRARNLLEQSIPAGYRLTNFYPITQTGRHPHRWVCHFERVDGVYNYDCAYLTDVRTSFREVCPAGCEIHQIAVSNSPNGQFIMVQYLVNCRCSKVVHKRSFLDNYYNRPCSTSYTRESTTCTGIKRNRNRTKPE